MISVGKPCACALVFALAAAASWFVIGHAAQESLAQPPTGPRLAATVQPQERPADDAAVRQAVTAFAATFGKGDAKALATHWTEAGEYLSADGAAFRGRTALEKAYTDHFAKSRDDALDVEVETIRFPSQNSAVVEGHFKARHGKARELVVSRCSLLYVREDGKWLIAIAREWPGDGTSLRDLEFLIGTWTAKRDGAEVRTTYEWTENKSFIRCRFSVTRDGKAAVGVQMIGKDPSTGVLRMWTFEDEGGIGEAVLLRDGKKWVQDSRGVSADGHVLAATNILTPVDSDSFTWQSVERTLDDEPQPDLPPVKVTRAKGKP